MGVQSTWGRVLLLSLSGTGAALCIAAPADPAVKKSRNDVCHERGTHVYGQTRHFTPFATLDACLKSGGRLPKNVAHKSSAFDASSPARVGDEGVQFGPLVRVVDGDTLVVKIQGAEASFRLSGIDAPERDQRFGREAADELKTIVGGGQCVLQVVETDSYGRTVAHLWIGDTYVNAEMMRRGMAWFDSQYAQDESLYLVEEEAREERKGLWALPPDERVPPWEWRHDKR